MQKFEMSLPQQQFFANHNGQIYIIANPNTIPGYYLPARINSISQNPALPQQHAESSQQLQPQSQLQSPQQVQQTQHQIQQQPKPKSRNQTNIKLKAIKDKCVSHYIDGQLIIETSKPLTDRKKKRKRISSTSQVEHQSHIQQQPQQQPIQQLQLSKQPVQQIQLSHQPIKKPHIQTSSSPQPTPNSDIKSDPKSNGELRDEMSNWTVDDVVRFIEKHDDIKEYSSKFAEDDIDGKALLLIIDRDLSFQVLTSMFKHGPAIKIEASLSKYKLDDKLSGSFTGSNR